MTLNFPKPSFDQWALMAVGLTLVLFLAGFFFLRGGELERSFERYEHRHDGAHQPLDDHDWNWELGELEKELVESPNDKILLGRRAHLLMERKPDKALGAYRELLKKDPKDPYVRLHLAQALAVNGKFSEAMGYAAVLLKEERALETLELVARIHYEQGRFRSCLTFAEEVLALEPNHPGAKVLERYSRHGISLEKKGQ